MATRIVQIEVRGEGGQFTAEVQRMYDKTTQFTRAATQGAEQTTASFRIMTSGLSALQKQLLATFSVGAIIGFARSVGQSVAELQDLSDQTGIFATNLATLRQAGIATGQPIGDIATSIVRLQRSLVEAREKGTGPTFEALQKLGISSKELTAALTDPNKLIEIITGRLGAMENVAQRNATAMDLAGRSGGRLGTTLQELARNQEAYRQSSILTNEQVKIVDAGIDQFAQHWMRLKESIAAAVVELAKWIGLIERTKVEQVNEQIKRNGDALRIQTEHLNRLREAQQKGLIEPRHEAARQKDIEETTRRIFGLIEEQEALNKALKGAEDAAKPTPPTPIGPAGDSDAAQKRAQQAAEAVAKLNIEQAKLNLTNLEAARTSGALSEAQLAQGLNVGNLDEAIRAATLALIDQEKRAALAAAANDKILTPALRKAIEAQADSKIATFEASEATRRHKEILDLARRAAEGDAEAQKRLGEALEGSARDREILNQRALEAIDIQRQLGDLEADRLVALGKTNDAEVLRLETQIKYLQALKDAEALQGKDTAQLRTAQISTAQAQLQRLGQITVDIGQHIGNTLENIFTSIISGTLKSVDVGKAALATIGNIATDAFRQIITKKLAFEVTLFDNMRGLPGQMNSAVQQGSSGTGGGGGGLFDSIFQALGFGGGGAIGTGQTIPGLGGSVGAFLGATPGSGSGGFMSSIGGGAIFGGIVGLLQAALSGGFQKGMIGGTIGGIGGGIGGGVAGSFFGPAGTIIGSFLGSTIGKLIGSLFDSVPNPTVLLRAKFSGIFYDAIEDVFKAGTVSTRITGTSDISGGAATKIKTQVQSILEGLSRDWTDILNIFPVTVRDSMIPSLERANEILNLLYKRLKFTEGGSNTIADEIRLLETVGGPQRFFFALRETIGKGIAASLGRAGLTGFDQQIADLFTGLPEGVTRKAQALLAPGLKPPKKAEDMEAFTEALKSFAGITGGLGALSPAGIGQFLTAADMAALQEQIGGVLGITDGKQFTKAVEQMEERLKPVLDFLQQSVQQTTEIFGRGLIAALDAATSSEAHQLFLNSLGTGVKDMIFQGITEAFIASAQFNDLLAPIQQTIRDFTQQAIATGTTPDMEAFRRAILPDIENITTRAELLSTLIDAFNKFGFDIKDALAPLIGAQAASTGSNNVTINLYGASNPEETARRIEELLTGRIGPAS